MALHFSVALVKAEIKGFRKRFKSIKQSTIRCLEKCCIAVMTVAYMLTEIRAVEQHKVFLEKKQEQLSASKNHWELFGKLNLYWNYLAYDLLDQLIEELTEEVNSFRAISEDMVGYKSDLRKFRKRTRLRLFCQAQNGSTAGEEPPPGFKRVVVKHKWPKGVTLEYVETFRRRYARKYNLKECALMLGSIIEGSFTVTWFVPVTIVEVLRNGRPLQVYEEFEVSSVEIAGVCVYQCQVSCRSTVILEYKYIFCRRK